MNQTIIRSTVLALCSLAFFNATSVKAQDTAETKEQRDARMAWWREARFGMFIHWGVYSVPAGIYKGKQVGGIGEWIMNRGKIPMAEYQRIRQAVQPGEIQRRRMGEARQGRGHEIHRHHHQASRRLRDVRFQGQRLEHRQGHALRQATRSRHLPPPAASTASNSASTTRRRRTGTMAVPPSGGKWDPAQDTAWTTTSTKSPCRR